jgi:hypothetical protein
MHPRNENNKKLETKFQDLISNKFYSCTVKQVNKSMKNRNARRLGRQLW